MFVKKLVLIFLFLILCSKAFPAVFIVTSNADSGPGTLRDALTQAAANGTAQKDYINFNLPDVSAAGRTILLQSQLPDLSSNLVIDGTTQAGAVFGQSNAHIKISTPNNNIGLIIFNGTHLNDVEFYGLYLYDSTDAAYPHPNLGIREGINITYSTNIIIGDVNKGNLIKGFFGYGVFLYYTNTISVKANIFGLTDKTDLSEGQSYSDYFLNCNNITLGGQTLPEGNTFFNEIDLDFEPNSNNINVIIGSNNFGVIKNLATNQYFVASAFAYMRINTYGLQEYGATTPELAGAASVNMNIVNNLAYNTFNLFRINSFKGLINITRNYVGIDRDGVTPINGITEYSTYGGIPFFISNCTAQINIGSDDPSQENFIAYSLYAITAGNSSNIYVRKNEYQCLANTPYFNDNVNNSLPKISITSSNSVNGQTSIAGTSAPGALIDIYSSESCTYSHCSIRRYIATVTADGNGNWQSGLFNLSGIFYVSSTVVNRTSEFKTFEINADKVVVTNLRCNNPGSVTGLIVPAGLTYYWTDQNGNTVSTNLNLTTKIPGKYQLHLQGGCIASNVYEIDDERIVINANGLVTTNPSCGQSNGVIKNINIYDPLNMIKQTLWFDAGAAQIANTINVTNLSAGTYTLKVFTTDECETDYGPITLKNTTGPNIDQSHANIASTNCGESTGSIANIQVTGSGTLKYSWLNDQQQQVATTPDLVNQPAGLYRLQVTDDSQCGPVFSTTIQIPETNGITLEESKVQTTVASCNMDNGTITGMQISGTAQYKWVDANNHIAATTPDLKNAPPGDYVFTAYNSFGCSKTSQIYHIGLQVATQYPAYSVNIVSACSGTSNGSVNITTDGLVASLRWVNGQGQTIGSAGVLDNIPKGTYQLYLTDANGCETIYNSYAVPELPALGVVNQGQVTNDQCGLKIGSVNDASITGGQTPYSYTWTDASGNQIGTESSISNLGSGPYTLNVVDTRCGSVKLNYTISDQSAYVAAPAVSDVQLCSSGDAIVSVNNPASSDTYRLYDDQNSAQPIGEEKSGRFKVTVNGNRSYFITQLSGTCESARSEVKVTVGVSAINIPNAFTPNGDGINDYWNLKGMENNPGSLVQVFTRYGQKVFESKGYQHPFDGTYGGKELPTGVYYYIINLGSNCNVLSGNLTIIR